MKINLLPLSIICLLILSSCKTKKSTSNLVVPEPQKLDSVLNYFVDEGYFPFVYAHLEDMEGNVIYEHSIVNRDLLPNAEINKDTWIRIWSMSKIITISVALDLVEDGLLKLEDPVTDYIPEFKNLEVAVTESGESLIDIAWGDRANACPIRRVPNDSVMTVLHLINHQAGFYYSFTGFDCLDSLSASIDLPKASDSQDLINRIAKLPLIQHSGTDYFYGTNTTVLGLVSERAAGKSLKQLVEERVTGPLQIKGLQYGLPSDATLLPRFTGRDSILRLARDGELNIFSENVPDYDSLHPLYLGGEGMVATADGYADFVRMLLHKGELNGHRFLDFETVEDIYSPHTQLDSPYGYNGYNLWVSGDTMRVQGTGEAGLWIGGGYECTYFWADPNRKFVGIVMSQNNEVRAPGYELNDRFRAALYEQFWERE